MKGETSPELAGSCSVDRLHLMMPGQGQEGQDAMAIKTVYLYTVTGRGPFPYDMLRYDRAWPAMESDSAVIEAASGRRMVLTPEPFKVTVEGLNPPTDGRWGSFGWFVTGDVRQVGV